MLLGLILFLGRWTIRLRWIGEMWLGNFWFVSQTRLEICHRVDIINASPLEAPHYLRHFQALGVINIRFSKETQFRQAAMPEQDFQFKLASNQNLRIHKLVFVR